MSTAPPPPPVAKSATLSPTTDTNVPLPVDPGCLPAWDVDELPPPKPIRARHLLTLIGPGLVLAGGSIGTGEWVMGPKTAAQYGGAMLWIVLVSILAQVVLNTEVMRYTLCTGEPIMTGFLRSRPGPKFWLITYLLLDVGGWWPAQAGLAAQILVVAWQGPGPQDAISKETVQLVSYAVFVVCAVMVLFGGKVYNTLQWVLGGKFLYTLGYLLLCAVFFVSFQTWGKIWGGLFDITRLPRDAAGNPTIDWALLSALAGFSGVGGMGNIMASNFVREKGWGMGAKVGAIPSAIGGHEIQLSHIGTICPSNETTRQRFRGWFRYLTVDQYLVWAAGSLVAMMLPCMLGAEYLRVDSLQASEQWRWAAALAQDFGASRGEIFRTLTLLAGLVIMVPGQFYSVDVTARRWTDAVWSGSGRARRLDPKRVKHLYYSFAGAYVLFGVCAYAFFPDLSATSMMVIAGNMANLAIAATIFHTLYVNRRFLPREVRPSPAKQVALVLAGLFFTTMFGLVVQQKIWPLLVTALGG